MLKNAGMSCGQRRNSNRTRRQLVLPEIALGLASILDYRGQSTEWARGPQSLPNPIKLRFAKCPIWHFGFDELEEKRLGKNSFGSTKSGIAPFYSDKYLKIGIQVGEIFDDEILMERLAKVCEIKNNYIKSMYAGADLLDAKALFEKISAYREKLKPMVANVTAFLHQAIKEGKEILLEGQLGSLKDTDNGIYPFVTSSSPLAVV